MPRYSLIRCDLVDGAGDRCWCNVSQFSHHHRALLMLRLDGKEYGLLCSCSGTSKPHSWELDTGPFLVFSGFPRALALTPTRLHSDRDIQVSRAITARRAICCWGEEADNSGSCLSSTNNPVSPPLRESYCFNMNNEWFNLSSGCQRTARRDYFLGTEVTFIGFESGGIGERPLVGRSGWMTDTDGRRKEDRERGKAGFAHLDEQQHAILLDWEIQYSELGWSKRGKKSSAAPIHPLTEKSQKHIK